MGGCHAPLITTLEVLVVWPLLAQHRLTTLACWQLCRACFSSSRATGWSCFVRDWSTSCSGSSQGHHPAAMAAASPSLTRQAACHQ
jgi:hypothetical protein